MQCLGAINLVRTDFMTDFSTHLPSTQMFTFEVPLFFCVRDFIDLMSSRSRVTVLPQNFIRLP